MDRNLLEMDRVETLPSCDEDERARYRFGPMRANVLGTTLTVLRKLRNYSSVEKLAHATEGITTGRLKAVERDEAKLTSAEAKQLGKLLQVDYRVLLQLQKDPSSIENAEERMRLRSMQELVALFIKELLEHLPSAAIEDRVGSKLTSAMSSRKAGVRSN